MELQPVVGASCAHCKKSILVDLDGRNCKRCGLAIHRKCGKAHRDECAGRPMVASGPHDYDEARPLQWTLPFVVALAVFAFVFATGVGMLSASGSNDAPAVAGEPSAPAAPPASRTKLYLAWSAVGAGAVGILAAYFVTRARQNRAPGPPESIRD